MDSDYIQRLLAAYPAIREIWLIGSRANNHARPESDWDFLVFSDDEATFGELHDDREFDVPGIDVLVAVDNLNAFNPWSTETDFGTRTLRLDVLGNSLDWQRTSDTTATYRPLDYPSRQVREGATLVYRRAGP